MAPQKSAWTDHIHSPISVLNHAKGLHLDRFTSADLDLITGCDDVLSLSLRSNKMSEPVDLARIAHIRSLHFLYLERLNFINLAALRSLPHLRVLTITAAQDQADAIPGGSGPASDDQPVALWQPDYRPGLRPKLYLPGRAGR
jgi:hypothetical protein